MSTDEIPDDLQALRQQWLMEHHRLGHPSQKRQTVLDSDGQTKPKVPELACPTCLASKTRKSNCPLSNSEGGAIPCSMGCYPQRKDCYPIGPRIQVLRGLRMHQHRRQTCGISHTQEPLHSRIPSPCQRARSPSAYTAHRPRNGISQYRDVSTP